MTRSTLQAPTERPPSPPARARHRFPWVAVLVLVGGLAFGALLNAEALLRSASAQGPGWPRDVMVAISERLIVISEALRLDLPRERLDEATGRSPTPTTSPAPTAPATTTPVTSTEPPQTTMTTHEHPTTTQPAPTTVTLPGVFQPTADAPAHLWVTGDSLTESFGPALVNLVTPAGVVEARGEVRYSTGLTRPDFFDWPAYLLQQIEETPTDILVLMVGANDGQPISTDAGWIEFGTEEWSTEYRHRVAATMDLLEDLVPTVYWIGQPIARSEDYSHKMAVMNEIYSSEASSRQNIRYVDSWQRFLDENGSYSAYLLDSSGRVVLMRRSDGIHLTPEGGHYLAEIVLQVISEDWSLTG